MNVWRGARRSIFSRILRTKTSTVRSRRVSRRPHTRCRSSSRVTTRPCSSASAYRSRNSVGVRPTGSPSTYASTWSGSIRSSSIWTGSPRAVSCGLAPRHPDGVEARGAEVLRHALTDDLVVLDDQHLGHLRLTIMTDGSPEGFEGGDEVVTIW